MTKDEKAIIVEAVTNKWEELAEEVKRDRITRGVAGGGYIQQEIQLSDTEPVHIKLIRNEWYALSKLAKSLNVAIPVSETAVKATDEVYRYLEHGNKQ